MVKSIFILVFSINGYSANADLEFPTLQQCEAAKSQIQSAFYHRGRIFDAVCIEVPAKKLKCKIGNNFSYHHPHPGHHSGSGAMENYPYPETIECTEE